MLKKLYEACQLAFACQDDMVMLQTLKDFEAELRKMLWQIETDDEVRGWNKAIKEILGEK